ncbi:MAG TPA: hypothetical protein VIK18_01785 [Pirellulales bacterium]
MALVLATVIFRIPAGRSRLPADSKLNRNGRQVEMDRVLPRVAISPFAA